MTLGFANFALSAILQLQSQILHPVFFSRTCVLVKYIHYDEESDHSNKAVRKTPEIESGHKVSEEVK